MIYRSRAFETGLIALLKRLKLVKDTWGDPMMITTAVRKAGETGPLHQSYKKRNTQIALQPHSLYGRTWNPSSPLLITGYTPKQ